MTRLTDRLARWESSSPDEQLELLDYLDGLTPREVLELIESIPAAAATPLVENGDETPGGLP